MISISGGSTPDANAFSIKVAKGMEDQQEKVVKTLISSIEPSAPSRAGFPTGQSLNIKA